MGLRHSWGEKCAYKRQDKGRGLTWLGSINDDPSKLLHSLPSTAEYAQTLYSIRLWPLLFDFLLSCWLDARRNSDALPMWIRWNHFFESSLKRWKDNAWSHQKSNYIPIICILQTISRCLRSRGYHKKEPCLYVGILTYCWNKITEPIVLSQHSFF